MASKKATTKKAADAKAKPRTKKDLGELAKKVVHAPQPKGTKVAHTEAQVLDKLQALDKANPGLPALELVTQACGEQTAKAVFTDKPAPATPRKIPSAEDLTAELLNLEIKLSKQAAKILDAEDEKKALTDRIKGMKEERDRLVRAVLDAIRDMRTGQGRLVFPATKEDGAATAKGEKAA